MPEDASVREEDLEMEVKEGDYLLTGIDSKDLEQELKDLGIGRRQFGCTPAQANTGVLNLTSTKGVKIYSAGCARLRPNGQEYHCLPETAQHLIRAVSVRAHKFG